jgi:SAM-dependent methyltransferase
MLRLKEYLRVNRHLLEKELGTDPRRQFFSPAYYSQYQCTVPLLQRHACGRLIDLGCGSMPYRQFVEPRVSAYDSLEFFPSADAAVTYLGDIQDMCMIADSTYDTAVCLEVLEHVPDPFRAAQEIHRILKSTGILIMSVPHLSRLHMEPHDYYRFTHYGLRHLLESVGFHITSLEARGSLFSFLGHQVATVWLGLVWRVPVVKEVSWFLSSWLVTRLAYHLDQQLDTTGIYAMGYTVVAHKMPKV